MQFMTPVRAAVPPGKNSKVFRQKRSFFNARFELGERLKK
jgi:hypothetical protein